MVTQKGTFYIFFMQHPLVCHYTIMPLVGFAVAHVFNFPPEIAAGIILVGCCASGPTSNILCIIPQKLSWHCRYRLPPSLPYWRRSYVILGTLMKVTDSPLAGCWHNRLPHEQKETERGVARAIGMGLKILLPVCSQFYIKPSS